MPLYTTIRPTTFDEVVGHDGICASLKRIVDKHAKGGDTPHAFLFTGPTGCGKTTLARILVREMGCGELDIKEMNAANTRGIDSIRQLVEGSGLPGLGGSGRAYILDESHQMTTPAQQALLKVLEDCPPRCYIALCTTDPQNLIPTIRNRCTKFELGSLRPNDIQQVIEDAEARANLGPIEQGTSTFIVRAADGCARTALVLREQVEGLSIDQAEEVIKKAALDEMGLKEMMRIMVDPRVSGWQKWVKVAAVYGKLKDQEPEGVRRGVIGYLKACLLNAKTDKAGERFCDMLEEFTGAPLYTSGDLVAMLYRACE